MAKPSDVRQFGYRNPRYLFPRMINIETPLPNGSRVIGTHGIDISVDGVAVSADVQFDHDEPVTLAIPLADGSVARVPGRVLYQSDDHCKFGFDFANPEQQEAIQQLIASFAKVR